MMCSASAFLASAITLFATVTGTRSLLGKTIADGEGFSNSCVECCEGKVTDWTKKFSSCLDNVDGRLSSSCKELPIGEAQILKECKPCNVEEEHEFFFDNNQEKFLTWLILATEDGFCQKMCSDKFISEGLAVSSEIKKLEIKSNELELDVMGDMQDNGESSHPTMASLAELDDGDASHAAMMAALSGSDPESCALSGVVYSGGISAGGQEAHGEIVVADSGRSADGSIYHTKGFSADGSIYHTKGFIANISIYHTKGFIANMFHGDCNGIQIKKLDVDGESWYEGGSGNCHAKSQVINIVCRGNNRFASKVWFGFAVNVKAASSLRLLEFADEKDLSVDELLEHPEYVEKAKSLLLHFAIQTRARGVALADAGKNVALVDLGNTGRAFRSKLEDRHLKMASAMFDEFIRKKPVILKKKANLVPTPPPPPPPCSLKTPWHSIR